MEITWHGRSCFTLKGKRATIVMDPFTDTGFKPQKLKADIVLSTRPLSLNQSQRAGGKTNLLEVEGDHQIFDLPGEYEVQEVAVNGMQTWGEKTKHTEGEEESENQDEKSQKNKKTKSEKSSTAPAAPASQNVIYTLRIDGLKICHLGSMREIPSNEMIEKIGDVDILLVPVGGQNVLDAKKAHEIVEEIEPRLVIPMCYKVSGEAGNETEAFDTIEAFLRACGAANEPKEEYVIAGRSALPQEKTDFVTLIPR